MGARAPAVGAHSGVRQQIAVVLQHRRLGGAEVVEIRPDVRNDLVHEATVVPPARAGRRSRFDLIQRTGPRTGIQRLDLPTSG